jgi:hypothetical protein
VIQTRMLYRNKLFLVLAALTALLSVTLVLRIYVWNETDREGFLTIPRVGEPVATTPKTTSATAPTTDTPEGVQADADWRSILEYVQKNPDKAAPFLADMKAKFFDASCGIKQPRIDFAHLADSYQPIFSA